MNLKKLLTLTAVGFASSGALAGKAMYAAPAPSMNRDTGVYIEGLLGYNRYAIADATGSTSEVIDSSIAWSNGNGNWAFGANIGYQFYQYFSAELGGIYSFKSKISFRKTNGDVFNGLSARPWYTYLAGRISLPVTDNLSIFTKLGIGYQRLVVDSSHLGSSAGNWGAMFGAGLIYNFTPAFYIYGQWLRFTGKVIAIGVDTTAPNIFLLGVGYKFAM